MNKLVMIFATLLLAVVFAGCAPSSGKDGINGRDGLRGNDGVAHSLVAVSRTASNLECLVTAGTAVDFYLDLDDSLDYSNGDTLQAGVVSCNGLNGLDGQDGQDGTDGVDGIDGVDGVDGEKGEKGDTGATGEAGAAGSSATMTAISLVQTNVCVLIHTSVYAKKTNNTDVSLYKDSNCSSNQQIDTNGNLTSMNNESYSNNNLILILEGYSSTLVMRKILFN